MKPIKTIEFNLDTKDEDTGFIVNKDEIGLRGGELALCIKEIIKLWDIPSSYFEKNPVWFEIYTEPVNECLKLELIDNNNYISAENDLPTFVDDTWFYLCSLLLTNNNILYVKMKYLEYAI